MSGCTKEIIAVCFEVIADSRVPSSQVSVVQYAVDAKFEFRLNQYKTKDEVVAAASRITQVYGPSTNTFHAIQYARLVTVWTHAVS